MDKKNKSTGNDLRESAHRIWLAGLGAVAMAEEEGGKLFRSLVDRGETFQQGFDGPVDKATERVRGTVRDVRSRTRSTLNRVEHALDDQLASALGRLGIPSRREITELTRKVEELTHRLDEQPARRRKRTARKPAAAPKVPARKTSSRKQTAASKPAVRKKVTRKSATAH